MWTFEVTLYDMVQGGHIRYHKKGAIKKIKGIQRFVVQGFLETLPPPPQNFIYKTSKGKKAVDCFMVNKKLDFLDLNRFEFMPSRSVLTGNKEKDMPLMKGIKSEKEFWASQRMREKQEAYKPKEHPFLKALPYVAPVLMFVIMAVIMIVLFDKITEVANALGSSGSMCAQLAKEVQCVQAVG